MAVAQQRRAITASMPAPIGGWNARDSLAEMNPLDAVVLENWYPTPTDVTLRKGFSRSSLLLTTTGVVSISTITNTGTLATLTTSSVHGLTTGTYVYVSGATPIEYNGFFQITVTSTTQFTYIMSFPPTGSATVVGTYQISVQNDVNSLMNYAGPITQKLFAAAGTTIYEATQPVATVAFTGITDTKFQHINITTAGGTFLIAVNGVDPMLVYDGTVWFKMATTTTAQTISSITRVGTTATVTTGSAHNLITGNRVTISGCTGADANLYNGTFVITSTGSTTFTYTMAGTPTGSAAGTPVYTVQGITGVNSSNFVNVNLFKNRLYFTEENTLKIWYLGVDSISGAATSFDLGAIARNGGFLQAMGTWTIDAGQGADDYAVFVTNMGEAIVYNGSNPSDPNDWALKGVWQLGQTFNRRCFFKWGGDLLLLTQDGLVPLASALQSSRLDPRINLTDKIYFAVSQAASVYYDNFGWQINYYASENMLILNIPADTGKEQYVMHTITKSWAKFTGINAICFEVSGKEGMYFGSKGYIGKWYDTNADLNNNITATAQQAYSYFDRRGQLKRFTMVRPIFQSVGGIPTVLCGLNVDFDTQNQLGAVTFNPVSTAGSKWDVAKWDEDLWAGGSTVSKVWQGVTGIGYADSINLNVASQNIDLRWASTDYVMETGGVL